jgi:hypothetical protein
MGSAHATRRLRHVTAGMPNGMTIPQEPAPVDPPEPEIVIVPERSAPVEIPEPSVQDTPERG